ncbi:MAG TPA: class I SAM-dependent methyltransferase [Acidobacteriaceae bacterium]|nr:class I SAM-dependent methyltransferase [Acidobacteriaceae bacterium]
MTAIEKQFVNRPSHARSVAEHALQLLERVDYQGSWRYLDVGCGIGTAAREVAAATGLSVVGIDVDPRQIEIARSGAANPKLNYQVMDAQKLEFSDGQFDIVASQMATHHIPDWERVVSEMARVLRVGGFLIYRDFVFPSWLGKIGRRLFRFMGFPSVSGLHAVAAGAGLTRVYQSHESRKVDTIWVKSS